MTYHIAFDVSHKPRGKIDENLTQLRDSLNSNDFTCYNFQDVLAGDSLKSFDILVFVCPDFIKIASHEITAIVNWVKDSGGGLLLLSHAGGDKGRGSNLSEISEQFGIAFENDQVLDERTNLGLENIPEISTFNIPHPITSGLDSLCYRSGCSLTIIGSGAFSLADSNETSEPYSCPLICVSESGKGRVCCIGSYEMFRDKVGGGFKCNEHPMLALNIFQWLISDYRMELRTNVDISAPIPHIVEDTNQSIESQTILINPDQSSKDSNDIKISINISNNRDLIKLLKDFQGQINTTKKILDELVEKVIASENGETETKIETSKSINYDTIQEVIPEGHQSDDINPELNQFSEKTDEQLDTENIQEESKLTTLPPKPNSLRESVNDQSSKLSIKPAPKLKTKAKTKKELKHEKEGLETKMSSVEDLLNFIDKKHSSGNLDDEEYHKRSKKLQSDLKKTKKRMNMIDKFLKK